MTDNPRFDYIKSKIQYLVDDYDCQYNDIITMMFDYIDAIADLPSNEIPKNELLEKLTMHIDITADTILAEKIDNHDFDDDEYTLVSKLIF